MIRINFIADDIAKEKHARIRNGALLGYASIWIISLVVLFARYQGQRSEIGAHNKSIKDYKDRIETLAPTFEKAVRLYGKRNAHRKELAKIFDRSIEPGFVVESLENLAAVLPRNFWLQKIHITSDKGKKADKKKTKGSKTMLLTGNVLLDMSNQDQEQVKRLQKTLEKRTPFSRAESYLNLEKMKVAKINQRHFHNFELHFSWPNIFL